MQHYFLLCTLLFYSFSGSTQSFELEHLSSSRTVAVHLPENYDPEQQYAALILLHGFSMNAQQMIEAMEKTAVYKTHLLFALDGKGDRHDDEFGGKEITFLEVLLDSIRQKFPINENKLLLSGFSYGGREALYWGMRHPKVFSGIIALSPAIQSRADANNQLPIPFPQPFSFENAAQLPFCFCYGAEEESWRPDIEYFIEQLRSEQARVKVKLAKGEGHSIWYRNFPANFNQCTQFIQSHEKK
jgi:enterochelin esterase-like enzyme